MSILSTSLPIASGAVVQNNAQGANARTNNVGAQNQMVQQAITSGAGQAAVVNLSKESRVASYGDSRSVDESFEKQKESGENGIKEKKAEQKQKAGKSLDVSA